MKGTVLDLIVMVVILCAFFIAVLFGLKVYNEMSGEEFWTQTTAGQTASQSLERTFDIMDYAFLFILVGSGIGTIISAFFIQTHPVFFVVSFLILIIMIAVSPIISNAFMEVAANEHFSTEADSMDIMMHSMGELPIVITVFGILVTIVLYAKYGRGDNI